MFKTHTSEDIEQHNGIRFKCNELNMHLKGGYNMKQTALTKGFGLMSVKV